ncbi:hypothetical protein GGI20_006240 [Coemansia sp. BCRC 34301]|nr:hypothetical protein GGI20_006240 [Coemansia sp. BCRC 34301]
MFTTSADPTYYDVLKCHGEFAEPSAFFSRNLRVVNGNAPSAEPLVIGGSPSSRVDAAKHRLRRAFASGPPNSTGGSDTYSVSSSSAFAPPGHSHDSLPSSVFRLPTTTNGGGIGGMTSGGRALRKANQVKMSVYDQKLSLF